MAEQPTDVKITITPERVPWICGRCDTSNAPHIDRCSCSPMPSEASVPGLWPSVLQPTPVHTELPGQDPTTPVPLTDTPLKFNT